jgi:hypothetical protein
MSSEGGYIKLYRRILENPVFENPRTLQVFLWALCRANYTARTVRFGGENITLRAGQFIAGRFTGAEACHMPPSTFRNQLAFLHAAGMLDSKSDNRKTVFTVVNWARFQGEGFREDSKPDNRRTQTRREEVKRIGPKDFADLMDSERTA